MLSNLRHSVVIAAALLVACVPAAHADIHWNHTYENGISQGRIANKPILIDFYADWCGPCQEMESSTWSDPTVQALGTQFVMVKLNVDTAQREAAAYGIDIIPATVFLNSKGQYLGKVGGGQSADQLAATMRRILASQQSTRAPATASQSPKNASNPVRVLQGGQVTQAPTTRSNWQDLPGMKKIAAQPGYSGVYLLDDNGTVPLDAPAQVKTKMTAKTKAKQATAKKTVR
jgi:thiol-disulfide isomerase/thioredoxin